MLIELNLTRKEWNSRFLWWWNNHSVLQFMGISWSGDYWWRKIQLNQSL